jgi:A/G-specific adenine glycosylase
MAETPPVPADLSRRLLAWYDAGHRDLPWRPQPHALGEPYGVWLSEVMLQQTTVAAVIPYYRAFLERWPTVADLAAASDAEVMAAWAGLGYYSRARNLLACARAVAVRPGGAFPRTEAELRALPGLGPYTAAAVAAIAFGQQAAAVDGNVERVLSRVFDDATPLPAFKPKARVLAQALVPADRPGDFAQAAIDLGAVVCRPRNPDCLICPWRDACRARANGTVALRPVRPEKPERPHRLGFAYWVESEHGVWLVRRPPKGLLGGMLALPCGDWTAEAVPLALPKGWRATILNAPVRHVFTHFSLDLTVVRVGAAGDPALVFGEGFWGTAADLAGLPTVMQKVRRRAEESSK